MMFDEVNRFNSPKAIEAGKQVMAVVVQHNKFNQVFNNCIQQIELMQSIRTPGGILIQADPGMGKTLMLQMVKKHLTDQGNAKEANRCLHIQLDSGVDISWQRPAVDICNCGTYLNDPDLCLQDPSNVLDLEVSRWMCQWIEGLPTQKTSSTGDLPLLRLIRPLSFRGGMHILWVLSLAEETKVINNNSVIDGQMLERCRKTILKANEFSQKLAMNDLETFRSKKRQTLIPQLALFMHKSYTYEDRSLAQSLISTILRASGKYPKTIGGLHVQLSLFSD